MVGTAFNRRVSGVDARLGTQLPDEKKVHLCKILP